ncbi:MAG: hypothetical protein JHC54_05830 [Acinetobacter sp.]|nr:hypothetical protein [Acinetobacter sp.]
MSNYRDDTLETLALSDRVWLAVKQLSDDTLKLSIAATFTLMVLTTEQLIASDEVIEGNSGFAVQEVLKLQEAATGRHNISLTTNEILKVLDSTVYMKADQVHEQLTLSEQPQSFIYSAITEKLRLTDSVLGKKFSSQFIYDSLSLKDSASVKYSNYVEESPLSISDIDSSRLSFKNLIFESLSLNDGDISRVVTLDHVAETLKIKDEINGKLYAVNDVHDYLIAFDEMQPDQFNGQAWTANTDTWAVSRYQPYNFEGLSVINDQVYAWNDQGVFVVGTEGEAIQAKLETGKLDFGESLVHPTAAYLEYEMLGADKQLNIAVTTTQSGKPSIYTYTLPNEQADHLTNGRLLFGRGLRGRHFAFGISIYAQSAKINSLSLEFTKTARRI